MKRGAGVTIEPLDGNFLEETHRVGEMPASGRVHGEEHVGQGVAVVEGAQALRRLKGTIEMAGADMQHQAAIAQFAIIGIGRKDAGEKFARRGVVLGVLSVQAGEVIGSELAVEVTCRPGLGPGGRRAGR